MYVVRSDLWVKARQLGELVGAGGDETVCAVEDLDLGAVADVI